MSQINGSASFVLGFQDLVGGEPCFGTMLGQRPRISPFEGVWTYVL